LEPAGVEPVSMEQTVAIISETVGVPLRLFPLLGTLLLAGAAGLIASSSATPAFVELSPPPMTAAGECVIEFEDGAGASMRIHLRGCEVPDVVALGRSFWSGE
jgi:hypothetical protein